MVKFYFFFFFDITVLGYCVPIFMSVTINMATLIRGDLDPSEQLRVYTDFSNTVI